MQILADYYKGEFRFGIVDADLEEELKLAHEVLTLPCTFFIKDGMHYQMGVHNYFYDNVRRFINYQYLNETKRYKMFESPRYIPNSFTKYGNYAYIDSLKWYNGKHATIFKYLKKNTPLVDTFPMIETFFK